MTRAWTREQGKALEQGDALGVERFPWGFSLFLLDSAALFSSALSLASVVFIPLPRQYATVCSVSRGGTTLWGPPGSWNKEKMK